MRPCYPMKLPAEVRVQILDHVFDDEDDRPFPLGRRGPETSRLRWRWLAPLHLNRTLRREAMEPFLAKRWFQTPPPHIFSAEDWFSRLPRWLAAGMKRLVVGDQYDGCEEKETPWRFENSETVPIASHLRPQLVWIRPWKWVCAAIPTRFVRIDWIYYQPENLPRTDIKAWPKKSSVACRNSRISKSSKSHTLLIPRSLNRSGSTLAAFAVMECC
jgi:hypothetical protein